MPVEFQVDSIRVRIRSQFDYCWSLFNYCVDSCLDSCRDSNMILVGCLQGARGLLRGPRFDPTWDASGVPHGSFCRILMGLLWDDKADSDGIQMRFT